MNNATIVCADALTWLPAHHGAGVVVTSLPDAAECEGMEVPEWEAWFVQAVRACLDATARGHPAVFFQTDRKWRGALVSKAGLILRAIGGHWDAWDVLWHKIVLRRAAGRVDLHRPGYSHLIAVARTGAGVRPGRTTPDVIPPSAGLYANGMPWEAARVAAAYVAALPGSPALVDPFCGRGTILRAALDAGVPAVWGVDIDAAQVAAAGAVCGAALMSAV
jgi:hypothetical protein